MKYFGIIDKNVAAIFQLQWKIWNISDTFLQYSVLCEYIVNICYTLKAYGTFDSLFNWRRSKFVLTDEYEEFGDCAASESGVVINFHAEIELDFLRPGDALSENENGLRGCGSSECEASLGCADYTWWCTHVYEGHAELYRWTR